MAELNTSRLFLRPFSPDDFAGLHQLNADPEVMRHIGTGVRDEEEMRLEGQRPRYGHQVDLFAIGRDDFRAALPT